MNLIAEALRYGRPQLLPCKVAIPAFYLVNIRQTAAPWLVVAIICLQTRPPICGKLQTATRYIVGLCMFTDHSPSRRLRTFCSLCLYCITYATRRNAVCVQRCCGRRRSWWRLSARALSDCRRAHRKEMSTASPSSCMRFSTAVDCSAVRTTARPFQPKVSLPTNEYNRLTDRLTIDNIGDRDLSVVCRFYCIWQILQNTDDVVNES